MKKTAFNEFIIDFQEIFCKFGVLFYDKSKNYMMKNYYYQVYPVRNSYPLWCAFFAYFILGNSAIMLSHNGFLHIINIIY